MPCVSLALPNFCCCSYRPFKAAWHIYSIHYYTLSKGSLQSTAIDGLSPCVVSVVSGMRSLNTIPTYSTSPHNKCMKYCCYRISEVLYAGWEDISTPVHISRVPHHHNFMDVSKQLVTKQFSSKKI